MVEPPKVSGTEEIVDPKFVKSLGGTKWCVVTVRVPVALPDPSTPDEFPNGTDKKNPELIVSSTNEARKNKIATPTIYLKDEVKSPERKKTETNNR